MSELAVTTTHHIDAGDRDEEGYYDYYYEYDLFEFSLGNEVLLARSYVHDLRDAHLICVIEGTTRRSLTAEDFRTPLVRESLAYLREIGKSELRWLTTTSEGPPYIPVPTGPETA